MQNYFLEMLSEWEKTTIYFVSDLQYLLLFKKIVSHSTQIGSKPIEFLSFKGTLRLFGPC
jgi:hypothetical protein